MKNILLLVCLIASQVLCANSFTGYKNHIATDRLIVMFDAGVTTEQKETIIKATGTVSSFTHLPSPQLTICNTVDLDATQKYFASNSNVKFVSFFITDGKNHYAGVLNNFFIKLKDKNFEPLLREKLSQLGLDMATPDKYIPNLYLANNNKQLNKNTIDVCALLLTEGWVEYAAPNYLLNPVVCSDPLYSRLWHIYNTGTTVQGNGTIDADMDVDSAWTITTGDPNIKIGLIDSGVDTLHSDLRANLLPGHDAVSDSTDGYPTPNYPNDGHGTCCAGILSAIKDNNLGGVGVAPGCKVIPVRAFYYIQLSTNGDPLPYSSAATFADAIGWSWSEAGADILSSSWALPDEFIGLLPGGKQPVEDAIHTAYTNARGGKGIAMFHSSGNGGTSNGPLWPGNLAETISVNASNMCDTPVDTGDCYNDDWSGDYGTGLDFAAPGVRIATTDMRGTKGFSNNDYELTFSGTSASCPNAAAVGALLLSVRPDFDAEDVRNVISLSCDKVGCSYDSVYANGTWCKRMGYGRVNAYRALQLSATYTGVKQLDSQVTLNVFPNPSKGICNVQLNGIHSAVAKFYTLAGQEIITATINEGLTTIDVAALPAGLYLLKADTGSGVVTRKVTIVR